MARSKLANLKLLMEDEEFDLTPTKHPVPDHHSCVDEQVHSSGSTRITGSQECTFPAYKATQSKVTEHATSTAEDKRRSPELKKPGTMVGNSFRSPQILDSVARDPEKRLLAQVAPSTLTFSPILAVSKYPYRYMKSPSTESEEVSRRFFAGGIFWRRHWTM